MSHLLLMLRLFCEFFRAGLFAVGGGLATIPFLQDISLRTGWFTAEELANMIAVSESTPGPMGVNMATYVGFTVQGVPGAVCATLGLVAPSIVVILIVARFLQKFRSSRVVDEVFYGLRPASTAMIASAGISVVVISLLDLTAWTGDAGSLVSVFQWKRIALAAVILVCTNVKQLKKLHPVVWIALAAVVGIVFSL
jgi:chromate transporter